MVHLIPHRIVVLSPRPWRIRTTCAFTLARRGPFRSGSARLGRSQKDGLPGSLAGSASAVQGHQLASLPFLIGSLVLALRCMACRLDIRVSNAPRCPWRGRWRALRGEGAGAALLSSPRYRGRTGVKHGDQLQQHGERPSQADRDYDGDDCRHIYAHLHPPCGRESYLAGRDIATESDTTGSNSDIATNDQTRPTATTTMIIHPSICIPHGVCR